MVSRGREVVGLELSGCCVVSTCCSKAGENVVSEGVSFSGCDMVEKDCFAGSSCRTRAMYMWSIGEADCGGMVSDDNSEVLSCREGCQREKAVRERRPWLRPSIKYISFRPRIDLCPSLVVK